MEVWFGVPQPVGPSQPTPAVLSRMFSGLVHGYQSLDPAVMSDDPTAAERLPTPVLHEIVEAAFARKPA